MYFCVLTENLSTHATRYGKATHRHGHRLSYKLVSVEYRRYRRLIGFYTSIKHTPTRNRLYFVQPSWILNQRATVAVACRCSTDTRARAPSEPIAHTRSYKITAVYAYTIQYVCVISSVLMCVVTSCCVRLVYIAQEALDYRTVAIEQ